MPGKPRLRTARPLTTAEKLGHVWGAIFLGMVLVLTVLLVGKSCLGG
ncbi:MAG: hypothetical protein AB1578_06705 [Thermodesulfobacteriota bacterium]